MTHSPIAEPTTDFEPVEDIQCPPTDLWSDEPPLESDFHRDQISLLIDILRERWCDRQDVYVSGNLTVYYNEQQLKSRDFRGPDFFVVLGTENKPRKSWVVWGEDGRYPNLIVEILSTSTAKVDRGLKKELYQNTFRTPDYFLFDPNTGELEGYHLVDGQYEPIGPNERGHLWSQQIELYLGVYEGTLRFWTAEGERLPTSREAAEAAQQVAEAAQQAAEAARSRAEQAEAELAQLKARLREQGIDMDG